MFGYMYKDRNESNIVGSNLTWFEVSVSHKSPQVELILVCIVVPIISHQIYTLTIQVKVILLNSLK